MESMTNIFLNERAAGCESRTGTHARLKDRSAVEQSLLVLFSFFTSVRSAGHLVLALCHVAFARHVGDHDRVRPSVARAVVCLIHLQSRICVPVQRLDLGKWSASQLVRPDCIALPSQLVRQGGQDTATAQAEGGRGRHSRGGACIGNSDQADGAHSEVLVEKVCP